MPQDTVGQSEVRLSDGEKCLLDVDRGSKWKMRDDQSVGLPSSFVHDNYISEVGFLRSLNKFIYAMISTIYGLRIRNTHFDFSTEY